MPPPVGVNVLENADWSDRLAAAQSFAKARWWHSNFTWDPLLCWGTGTNYIAADNAMRIEFDLSTELDPSEDGYGGLLYGGPGFDAEPGDSWHIEFTATRRTISAGFQGQGGLGQLNTNDLFVRVGICVRAGAGWTSYTMSLPTITMPDVNGAVMAYSVDFEIPSNWPAGQYQFAICHSGYKPLPVNSQTPPKGTDVYRVGWSIELSDLSLEYLSAGGGSPGAGGATNPYINWPVPFWTPHAQVLTEIGWQTWDDPIYGSPLTSAYAVRGPLPNAGGDHVLTAGWMQFNVYESNPITVYGYPGPPGPPVDIPPSEDGWGDQPFIPHGAALPEDIRPQAIFGCDSPTCHFLSVVYDQVPDREYFIHNIIFGDEFRPVSAFKIELVNPSMLRRYLGWTPIPISEFIFCWEVPCGEGPPLPVEPQPVYLTHEVAPGDPNIAAGGSGGLELRGIRAAPGDANAAATGPPGIDFGHIKGQP